MTICIHLIGPEHGQVNHENVQLLFIHKPHHRNTLECRLSVSMTLIHKVLCIPINTSQWSIRTRESHSLYTSTVFEVSLDYNDAQLLLNHKLGQRKSPRGLFSMDIAQTRKVSCIFVASSRRSRHNSICPSLRKDTNFDYE
jgi:hypothetical protein